MAFKRFQYTYTSPMRKLNEAKPAEQDASAQSGAAVGFSLGLGIISCLVFGLGLTCALEWKMYFLSILCGILGIAGMAYAPALYTRIIRRHGKDEK